MHLIIGQEWRSLAILTIENVVVEILPDEWLKDLVEGLAGQTQSAIVFSAQVVRKHQCKLRDSDEGRE